VSLTRHKVVLRGDAPARIARALEDETDLAARDARHLAELHDVRERFAEAGSPLILVPALASDVHDVAALAVVAEVLCPAT
jgi:hypothetical protein